MATRPLIVLDVNETLLDLQTMDPSFERIFGGKEAMRLWFANLVLYSAALTIAGCYVPFTDIGSARTCRRMWRFRWHCASCAVPGFGCSR
jgi:2-haloacid dehalogenase